MRLFCACLAFALLSVSTTPAQQSAVEGTPNQPTLLLRAIQAALTANRVEDFTALLSPSIDAGDRSGFELSQFGAGITGAVVRERDREQTGAGEWRLLVEMLVDRGGSGSISTWEVNAAARERAPRLSITGLHQVSAIGGLHRLELDTSTAFAVKDLAITAADFRLSMASGVAFVARADDGITAIVLRGQGALEFQPSDAAERQQIRRFSRKDTLAEPIDAAFIRIHPSEYSSRVSDGSLTPIPARPEDINRARGIFNQWASRSYNLNLGDLSPDRWSLFPAQGDALADMLTRRFGWLTYARTGSQAEDISLFDRNANKNISIYASPAKLATRGRFYSEDDGRAFDIEHYDLNVRFNPIKNEISGKTTMRLRVLRHDADTLNFKLAETLPISSVTSDEFGRLLTLRVIGQSSVITSFPEALPAGKILTLTFTYAGRLAPQPLDREAILFGDGTPQTLGQDNTADSMVVPPEPNWAYSNRSYWYPQGGYTDYATAKLRLTVPVEFQIVSSGTPMTSVTSGPDRTNSFSTDLPARYLAAIISRLQPSSQTSVPLLSGATLAIDAQANPRLVNRTKALADRAAQIIKFYTSVVGEAPYPSFTLLSLESLLPGGHSPPYFAALNQPMPTSPFTWRADPIAFDDQFPNFYVAHEIAHQWWGQAIANKNYHEQWLSEGLSQYFAYLYAGVDRGPEVQRNIMERMRQSVKRYADSGPIHLGYRLGHVVGDGQNFRAIVYNKSAIVLDMLRQFIGDEAFNAGLRRFYTENRFRKAGTDDLRLAFEAETKQPLQRFFDRWVLGSDLPNLRLTSVIETAGDAARIRIEQTGEVFDMPVQVEIDYRDQPSVRVTLKLTSAQTDERIPLAGPVKAIRLVPGLWGL